MAKAGGGKKGRKLGRNASWCAAYKARSQREKNKLRRLRKHIERFPSDHCATGCAGRLKAVLGASYERASVS